MRTTKRDLEAQVHRLQVDQGANNEEISKLRGKLNKQGEKLVQREEELTRVATELDQLQRQTLMDGPLTRQGKLMADHGLLVWEADGAEPIPCLCIGWGDTKLAINLYPTTGEVQGIVVTDGEKLAGAYGLIPAEVMMAEIEYSREHE